MGQLRDTDWPVIIQGGMGVAVSQWRLARAVSLQGQLGVVSGTGIDTVLVRRLQDGDPGGHIQRALAAAPWPDLVSTLIQRYYRPQGRSLNEPYKRLPHWTLDFTQWRSAVAMMGGFVEVWLAKAGHRGKVGINLLTKVALPNLPVLYGAMVAKVDVVLMGAGIPKEIPGALDTLSQHKVAEVPLEVEGQPTRNFPLMRFDPDRYSRNTVNMPMQRPAFFPIVSSHSLATFLTKKSSGSIQGLIIENPTAGGHNAPPRGPKTFDDQGQPCYGERDQVDFQVIRSLGLPFWLAGGYGTHDGIERAQKMGAHGIQVGTPFAYCQESGLTTELKTSVLTRISQHQPLNVRTDPDASPTGFPFKVVNMPRTLSEPDVYHRRRRLCDLGYLRTAYQTPSGRIDFRCAAEPITRFVAKGGRVDDTVDRRCLCNGLMSSVGLAQRQIDGTTEAPILTLGQEWELIYPLLGQNNPYRAEDVINLLLGRQ